MQRLTRYSLLLKAIIKKTDDQEQFAALEQMVSIDKVNYLKRRQEELIDIKIKTKTKIEIEITRTLTCSH